MKNAWRNVWRTLTFRITREEILRFDDKTLYLGLFCTWIVGMGRYWDDPRANLGQHFGVGSVVYVFVLSVILWAIAKPFRLSGWTYKRVLTYVTLTSPPAVLYAIPVERFMAIESAVTANGYFLLAVAALRVALLFRLYQRMTMPVPAAIVTMLLPLMAIVTALYALNLHHVVFDLMGGNRFDTRHGAEQPVLFLLVMLSTFGIVPVVLLYGGSVWFYRRNFAKGKTVA